MNNAYEYILLWDFKGKTCIEIQPNLLLSCWELVITYFVNLESVVCIHLFLYPVILATVPSYVLPGKDK